MKYILSISTLILAINCQADIQTALTQNGTQVILDDNGTWRYLEQKATINIQLNPNIFTKSKEQTFAIQSQKNPTQLWIDPNTWSFKKSDGTGEYEFRYKQGEVYAAMINESIGSQTEDIIKIAFQRARKVAPDAKIVQTEYRNVNGKKVIFMQMEGTISGIKFSYLSYYFANKNGMTQLMTYTGSSLVEQYKEAIEIFLNGFVAGKD
ncbi:MAG: hypothetical protein PHW18_01325 [Sulfuricurvum sp.]|uniref:hypothetical protein n=1 Tax=Sulfuricurvum sp. TaxID=2025608 RepID=UPI002610B5F1|nr:hypothetical protein [Sulfuricurvum sp.]MDD2828195.1 hypothetical protein [Sulfuricurvum sp.]MDD4949850.1 hypothetical protein [Sulfuricurvum sp.]